MRWQTISILTVSGLGSSTLCSNDMAAGENQNGHENSAAFICTWKEKSESF